jgi:hypothetical protein
MTTAPPASARASRGRAETAAAVRLPAMRRPALRGAAACVAAALAVATATAGGQPPGALRVQAGVTVTPDTVTVGDPFVVQVRVAAPAGATVEFPAGPDSAGAVALLDPRRDQAARGRDGGVDVTATYRVAAWDVGVLPLGLGDVVVLAGGAERRVSLADRRVWCARCCPATARAACRARCGIRCPTPACGGCRGHSPRWRWRCCSACCGGSPGAGCACGARGFPRTWRTARRWRRSGASTACSS